MVLVILLAYLITHRNGANSQRVLQEMTSAGACKLNYDGGTKLQTTADGVILNGATDISHSSADNLQVGTGKWL